MTQRDKKKKKSPAPPPVYEPPRIIWEQRFIALAQVSGGECIPGRDPQCS